MASIAREKNEEVAAQLSVEQKARLDEVIKQAELSKVSEEVLNQSLAVLAESEGIDKAAAAQLQRIVVNGYIGNQTNGTVATATDMQHIYTGNVVIDFPSSIFSGATGNFAMVGNGSVEAAVWYSGKNNNGNADCGWLVGFLADGTADCHIYVLCGPITDFINLDWDEIETKIKRGADLGYYYDGSKTGTQIYGYIAGDGNGNYTLSVAFYG